MSASPRIVHLPQPWPLPRRALVALACVLAAMPLYAEKTNRDEPLNVEADSGRYDDLKQIGVFVGNVVVSKGTMVLRASRVELRQSPEGYQLGVATGSPGQLASFRQKRDGVDESIEGQAERIEYDGRTDSIRFVDRAVVRRFRGAALVDETSGGLITYDNVAATFSVSGGASSVSPANPVGRVRARIVPNSVPPEAAASRADSAGTGAASRDTR